VSEAKRIVCCSSVCGQSTLEIGAKGWGVRTGLPFTFKEGPAKGTEMACFMQFAHCFNSPDMPICSDNRSEGTAT